MTTIEQTNDKKTKNGRLLSPAGLATTPQRKGMQEYHLHPHNQGGKWFASDLERAAGKRAYEKMAYPDLVAMPEDKIEKMYELFKKARKNVINEVALEDIHQRGFFPLDLETLDRKIRSYGFELIEGKNIFDSSHINLNKNITLWYFFPKKNLILKFDDDNSVKGTSDFYVGFVTDAHVKKISKGIPFIRYHKTYHYKDQILSEKTNDEIGDVIQSLLDLEKEFSKYRDELFTIPDACLFESCVADIRGSKGRLQNNLVQPTLQRLVNSNGFITGKDLFSSLYVLYTRSYREHAIEIVDGKPSYKYLNRISLHPENRVSFDRDYRKYIIWYVKKFK